MPKPPAATLQARKQPRQARSQVTVDAVFEACIQVLLSDGHQRLTTTRVAERAGVSVGTLYQYYPHKQALLYAVLERHLARIGATVEAAALAVHHAPLATMVDATITAYLRAKTEDVDEARALYGVAGELDAAALIRMAEKRGVRAIADMLATAPDARFEDLPLTAYMLCAAIVGPTRSMLEGGAPQRMLRALPAQLRSLCMGYLEREALPV